MDNLPEKENNLPPEEDFSTIFADPTAHKQVKKPPAKKRLKMVLSLVLAFAVLVGGTFAVIKLIPEKEDETPDSNEEILVLNCEEEVIKNVVVKNENGTFKFLWRTVTEEAEEEGATPTEYTVWRLDGVDETLTSSNTISNFVDKLTYISAIREITSKSEEQCGFDKPRAEATLNLEEREVKVLIGDKSPDNVGTYLKVSTSDKIYLVNEAVGDSLVFNALDLADAETEEPLVLDEDYAKYYAGESIASFDKLVASSIEDDYRLVFEPNADSQLASYVPFLVVEPKKRAAENVSNLLSVFSSGFYTEGAYSYDVSKETIKKFGLDSPDYILSATFKDYTYTYKFKKQRDGYYAYIGNDSKNVKKVSSEYCGFLTCDPTFFYSKTVFVTPLADIKNLTIDTAKKSYSFDITDNPSGNEDNMYIVECNGKTIDCSNFQSYYQYLCILECMDFDVVKTNQKPELSITYTYEDEDTKSTKIDFIKLNATKYQYSIDGVPMGKIGSTSYKKITKLLDRLLEGKTITVN